MNIIRFFLFEFTLQSIFGNTMKLAMFSPLLQAADSSLTGKERVGNSIDSLTMTIVVVAVLGAFFIVRMLLRQKREPSE